MRHQLALAVVEVFIELSGVAAGRFGARGLKRHFNELGAKAFHLFLDGRTNIVRLDNGA